MRAGVCARWHVLKACACVHVCAGVGHSGRGLPEKMCFAQDWLSWLQRSSCIFFPAWLRCIAATLHATLYCYILACMAQVRCVAAGVALVRAVVCAAMTCAGGERGMREEISWMVG